MTSESRKSGAVVRTRATVARTTGLKAVASSDSSAAVTQPSMVRFADKAIYELCFKLFHMNHSWSSGRISSNGGDGANYTTHEHGPQSTGGASGGSIWISADHLGGGGTIEANGGDSTINGGGGSGGRIAVYYNGEEWTGSMTTYGGRADDRRVGAAGTVYTEEALSNDGLNRILTIDNRDAHQLWLRDDPDDPEDEEVRYSSYAYTYSNTCSACSITFISCAERLDQELDEPGRIRRQSYLHHLPQRRQLVPV